MSRDGRVSVEELAQAIAVHWKTSVDQEIREEAATLLRQFDIRPRFTVIPDDLTLPWEGGE